MASNILLTSEQFQFIKSTYSICKNHSEQQELKLSLMENVKKSFGDKWDRLASKTKKLLDYCLWSAADKGVIFASYEYLANKHDMNPKTVHRRLQELVKNGLAVKLYRRSPNHNGKGKPVYLFTDHPLYSRYSSFLELDKLSETDKILSEVPAETNSDVPKNPFGTVVSKVNKVAQKVATDFYKKQERNNKYPYSRSFINQEDTILRLFYSKMEDAAKQGIKINNVQAWFRKILDKFVAQEQLKEFKFEKAQRNSASVPDFVPSLSWLDG
ncbi:hypothetical protein ACI2JA_19735 [Alkalihalobacillus sp. NPDC078783]|uniref:hypothetical protein n=1 Tax=Streptomyces albidoflavus TaxID=1886 RepID=UPI0033C8E41B